MSIELQGRTHWRLELGILPRPDMCPDQLQPAASECFLYIRRSRSLSSTALVVPMMFHCSVSCIRFSASSPMMRLHWGLAWQQYARSCSVHVCPYRNEKRWRSILRGLWCFASSCKDTGCTRVFMAWHIIIILAVYRVKSRVDNNYFVLWFV